MLLKKIGIIITICIIMMLCSCGKQGTTQQNIKNDDLHISILDAGKADAIILRTSEHTAIIDCGEKDFGNDILYCLSQNNISKVDYMFITHFDKDHVGGSAQVISNVEVCSIITPDYESTSGEYKRFVAAAKEKNIEITRLTDEMHLSLDNVFFDVYPPLKSVYAEEDNDYSLAISVTHGNNKLLFAGDAERERLSEFSSQFDLKHDFLKVPHHGRYNKATEAFIKDVSPKYAVITCSEEEMPDKKTLTALENVNTDVYMTTNGTVDVVSNGEELNIMQNTAS